MSYPRIDICKDLTEIGFTKTKKMIKDPRNTSIEYVCPDFSELLSFMPNNITKNLVIKFDTGVYNEGTIIYEDNTFGITSDFMLKPADDSYNSLEDAFAILITRLYLNEKIDKNTENDITTLNSPRNDYTNVLKETCKRCGGSLCMYYTPKCYFCNKPHIQDGALNFIDCKNYIEYQEGLKNQSIDWESPCSNDSFVRGLSNFFSEDTEEYKLFKKYFPEYKLEDVLFEVSW